jgi:CheY-like chemotaxis protein
MITVVPTVEAVMEKDVRLLIADECPETLALLLRRTESLGWTGTVVNSASKIIEAVNSCAYKGCVFDAIIADVSFQDSDPTPKMTGITAVREIRKVLPDLPIVFITEYINSIMREEARRVNTELMPKPLDLDALFERVNSLVKWYRSVMTPPYIGAERRLTSFNLSDEERRIGDRILTPSPRIAAVLAELRDDEQAKSL